MRQLITCCIIFFSCLINASAQYDTIIGQPPGYSISQLRPARGISIDPSGNVWIPFGRIGLSKYDGSGWTVYDSLNSGLLKNKILSVATNSMGVWAGSDTGLYNFDGTNWTRMTVANNNLPSDTINNLYSPGGNDLYIFSSSGFSYYNGTSWQHFNTGNSGLISDTVQCLYKSTAGILWVGTKNGLSKFDGNTWQSFTTSNSEIMDNDIRSLMEDGNHNLFIGTENMWIMFYDGSNFSPVRNSINSYYNVTSWARNLLKLQNGDVLFSTTHDYIFSSNPLDNRMYSGFQACDTTFYSAVDANNRIWRVFKIVTPLALWRRDSLDYAPEYSVPHDYNDLDINKVRCGMFNNATIHFDLTNTGKYEVPKGTGKNSVFASAFWIGGMDSTNNLHLSAQTYRQSGVDFWPGPLDTLTATIDAPTSDLYDSIWKVDRHMIDEFITQFDLGNVTNGSYHIPGVILSWPAHGSGNYSRQIAPFVDHNADGIYNPMDGDYPEIKGDQMLWWILNDTYQHSKTNAIPLGIEIHFKAYAYNCLNIPDSNEAVNYTTFYSIDIINRGQNDYHDVYIGLFADCDLGFYDDDYIGCNVENDIGFSYNGDNNDEGIAGYGLNPPMQSVAILKGPLAEPNDSIDNNHNGILDEVGEVCMMNHFMHYYDSSDPIEGYPETANDYYNYLRSIWRNFTHLKYGGDGQGNGVGGTNTPADYFFPGTPYDTGWTESAASNFPIDRRMLLSSGPFKLNSGETKTIDYAYIFTRDESAPNGLNTSIAKNIADVKRVKRWFDTDSFPCNNSSIGIEELNGNSINFSVYPNPASDHVTVRINSASGKTTLELFNIIGEKLSDYIFPEGRKEFSIKTGSLSKGIYFLRLSGESGSVTKKLVVR